MMPFLSLSLSLSLQCTRLVTAVLQHQKEPYDFPFVPEVSKTYSLSSFSPSNLLFYLLQISKVLLCTPVPGDEDSLYQFVDKIEDK